MKKKDGSKYKKLFPPDTLVIQEISMLFSQFSSDQQYV